MSIAKKLVGQTAAYGLSSIVGRTLNFLLVPIYTEVFHPAEYGIVTYLYAFVAFFNILYTFGLETAFFRFANKPEADKQRLYNQVLSIIICTSIVFTTLIILASGTIADYLAYTPEQEKYIIWLAIILAIDAIVAIPFAGFDSKIKLLSLPLSSL